MKKREYIVGYVIGCDINIHGLMAFRNAEERTCLRHVIPPFITFSTKSRMCDATISDPRLTSYACMCAADKEGFLYVHIVELITVFIVQSYIYDPLRFIFRYYTELFAGNSVGDEVCSSNASEIAIRSLVYKNVR